MVCYVIRIYWEGHRYIPIMQYLRSAGFPFCFQFVGGPCGQHGPYTFYKAFRFTKENQPNILSLGEFFYVKIFKEVDVCIGELQLLWEDRYNAGQLLCMLRLYFLPEQTPDGRKQNTGEVTI